MNQLFIALHQEQGSKRKKTILKKSKLCMCATFSFFSLLRLCAYDTNTTNIPCLMSSELNTGPKDDKYGL